MGSVFDLVINVIQSARATNSRKAVASHLVDSVFTCGLDARRGVRDLLVSPKTTDDMWNNEQNLFRALDRSESNLANHAVVVSLLPAVIHAFPQIAEQHLNDFLNPLGVVCHLMDPEAKARHDLKVLVGKSCKEHGESANAALTHLLAGDDESRLVAIKEAHEALAACQSVLSALEAITPKK
ncbi:MAG: hypothetical protein ACRC1V_11770 [Plesiomonas sp.]